MSIFSSDLLTKLREHVAYHAFSLSFLCCAVTLLLMTGQEVTEEDIKKRLQEDRQALLNQVLPSAYYDNDPFEDIRLFEDASLSDKAIEVYLAKKEGQVSAVLFELIAPGYGGDIQLLVSLDTDGNILGLRTISHKETPGLADKIEILKSDWITSFNGESLTKTPEGDWQVKKDGGKFDQFSGATITPRAIVRQVHKGLLFYAKHAQDLMKNDFEEKSHE